jgi:hypothetical protein
MVFRQERLYTESLARDIVSAIERNSKALLFLADRMTLQLPYRTAWRSSPELKSRLYSSCSLAFEASTVTCSGSLRPHSDHKGLFFLSLQGYKDVFRQYKQFQFVSSSHA